MFEIRKAGEGRIELEGRFDASQEGRARELLDSIEGPTVIDFGGLKYIASAGLGILLRAQKKLVAEGHSLKIVNLNPHIREIFEMAGFDRIFDLE